MGFREWVQTYVGQAGVISFYLRPSGECPAAEFLEEAPDALRNRFIRFFQAFASVGWAMLRPNRFSPVRGPGKGLYSIKVFDHRLYCVRLPDIVEPGRTPLVHLLLLSGWVKDKDSRLGAGTEENREIERALTLSQEAHMRLSRGETIVIGSTAPPEPAPPEPAPTEALPEESMESSWGGSPETPQETQARSVEGLEHSPEEVGEAQAAPQTEDQAAGAVTEKKEGEMKEQLSVSDLAKLTGVPHRTLLLYIQKGRLPAPKRGPGRTGRYTWSWDQADWLSAKVQELVSQRKRERRPNQRGDLVGIRELASELGVRPSCVYYHRRSLEGGKFVGGRLVWDRSRKEALVASLRKILERRVSSCSRTELPKRSELETRFSEILAGRGTIADLEELCQKAVAWMKAAQDLRERLSRLED